MSHLPYKGYGDWPGLRLDKLVLKNDECQGNKSMKEKQIEAFLGYIVMNSKHIRPLSVALTLAILHTNLHISHSG